MSEIPAGLRADYMRKRMEDKATITVTGGLYVGGTTRTTYMNPNGITIPAVVTEQLPPGPSGYPLVSNGAGNKPTYQQIVNNMILDHSISPTKIQSLVIDANDVPHVLKVQVHPSNSAILQILYYPESNS